MSYEQESHYFEGLSFPVREIAGNGVIVAATLLVPIAAVWATKAGWEDLAVVALLGASLSVLIVGGLQQLLNLTMIFALFMLAWTGVRISSSVAASDVMFVLAAAVILVSIAPRLTQMPFEFRPLLVGSGVLCVGALLASVFASDIMASISRMVNVAIAALVLPGIVGLWNPTLRVLRIAVVGWVVSVLISSAYGIVNGPTLGVSSTRISGLATHHNNLALCCVLALGPAIALAVFHTGVYRLVGVASTFVLLVGVLLSGSRAGFIGIAVVVAVMLLVMEKRRAVASLLLFGAVVFVAVYSGWISLGEGNALARLFSESDSSSVVLSDSAREDRLSAGMEQVMEKPLLGVGLQTARAAHNVYVQLLASMGILGLAGFLTVAWISIRPLARVGRYQGSDNIRRCDIMLLAGLIASYTGFLVAEVASNALWERFMWLPPALIVALYSRLSNYEESGRVQ